jgi:hypothetical protein
MKHQTSTPLRVQALALVHVLAARLDAPPLDYRDWQTISQQVAQLQKLSREAVRSFVMTAEQGERLGVAVEPVVEPEPVRPSVALPPSAADQRHGERVAVEQLVLGYLRETYRLAEVVGRKEPVLTAASVTDYLDQLGALPEWLGDLTRNRRRREVYNALARLVRAGAIVASYTVIHGHDVLAYNPVG